MHHFHYKNKKLHCENVPLERIAEEVGTPTYVYSYATLERHFRLFDQAFGKIPHLTCFAMKTNSNIALLRAISRWGGGVDLVSGGELFRAFTAGIPPHRMVYSGVGKTEKEMALALEKGILLFNVESEEELLLLNEVAKKIGKRAPVGIRVNPEINPKTHPYIATGLKKSKFGVSLQKSLPLYAKGRQLSGIQILGVSCHIGSQITQLGPFVETVKKLKSFLLKLRENGFSIKYLDLGGGLGIPYKNERPPTPDQYGKRLSQELKGLGVALLLEPGRVIAGNAGILLMRTLYKKKQGNRNYLIVDGGMNDLIRPSLYGSFHDLWPVDQRGGKKEKTDVVGPVCESGDFLAKDRSLPILKPPALVAMMTAGAYGFTMASNYNSRPRAAEVLVKGGEFFVVRKREEYKDLLKGESVPKFLR